MMGFTWQETGALVLVVVAVLYVGRRFWRFVCGKTPSQCLSCGGCAKSSEERPLVTLDKSEQE